MQIREEHIREFESDGATTFDGPFSDAEIAAANARVEELNAQNALRGGTLQLVEPTLLDLIQHPALEEAAKQFLYAEEVEFVAWIAMQKDPQPGSEFRQEYEHQDIRYSSHRLEAKPRQILVTFLLWLTDVTMDRAPFMYRRGSHRQIAEHVAATEGADENGCKVAAYYADTLPPLEYSEPQPILARAGQISAVTTSLVHSGSTNIGNLPRRVMFINFAPKGVPILFDSINSEQQRAYQEKLRAAFRPERLHLLPS